MLDWLGRAASLGGKRLNVAVAIKYLHGMNGNRPFKLTTTALKAMNVSRQAGYKALEKLETAGLIRVERKPGALPQITVLETDT